MIILYFPLDITVEVNGESQHGNPKDWHVSFLGRVRWSTSNLF